MLPIELCQGVGTKEAQWNRNKTKGKDDCYIFDKKRYFVCLTTCRVFDICSARDPKKNLLKKTKVVTTKK